MDDGNSTTTRLLTLLNVSAVMAGKRKQPFDDSVPVRKLNKRKSVLFADALDGAEKPTTPINAERREEVDTEQQDLKDDSESQGMFSLSCPLHNVQ